MRSGPQNHDRPRYGTGLSANRDAIKRRGVRNTATAVLRKATTS